MFKVHDSIHLASCMTVAERLVHVRKSLGLNQIPFAEKLGVSQSAYKNYEREATDLPINVAIKLCQEYRVSAEWLLLGRAGMNEQMSDEIIEKAVITTRKFLKDNGFEIAPEKEAKIVRYLVRKMAGTGEISPHETEEIIRLVI